MNADGTNKTRLTNNWDSNYDPTFSPDGSKIAFVAYSSGFEDIYVMNSDGTNRRRLTNNTAGESSPTFSPDGSKIAFSSGSFGSGGGFGGEIYVMNADGTNPMNITNHPDDDISPTFSPNGLKIAFSSRRGNTYDIYVMIADGANQVRLANTPLVHDFAPSWGRQAAGCDANAAPVANNDAYVANEDTSPLKRY
jgi:Tol biopolymer transport system component